jgi:hypothetical protein
MGMGYSKIGVGAPLPHPVGVWSSAVPVRLLQRGNDEGVAMYIVIVETTVAYGPFFTREAAESFADEVKGVVFLLIDPLVRV